MRLALTTSIKPAFPFEFRVSVNYNKRNLFCHSFSRRPELIHGLAPKICSSKVSAAKHIDYMTNFSSFLHNFAGQIFDAAPQPIREFPWEKAKLMVEERLFVLGKSAFKWSLVALLVFSFAYDSLMAVFVSRELAVPLGLFVGILMANFLKESFQELFGSNVEGGNELQQLWGLGLFFVALRFIFSRFRLPLWLLLSHIGNGGLMQILWLIKGREQTGIIQNEEKVDALQPAMD